jgi:hypothetical protein
MYMHSFNETLDHYRAMLLAQREGRLQLPNDNLDTGGITGPADYRLTDVTYARLLDKTTGKPVSDALRLDILAYYADPDKAFVTKQNPEAWQKVLDQLNSLKSSPTSGVPTR